MPAKRWIHWGALWLCIAAFATLPANGEAVSDADLQVLQTRWEAAFDEIGLPGLAIAIVEGDAVRYARGFGHSDAAHTRPFTPGTPTYIASVTKPFTALAILQLAAQEKLSLDDPVQSYLPEFALADPTLSRVITVRNLLCHRYGLDSWAITFAEAYTGEMDDAVYFELLKTGNIEGEWRYSNLHYTLLGRIIQRVSGVPWQEYLKQSLFDPMEMTHTTARASVLYAFADAAEPLMLSQGEWVPARYRKSDATMHAAGGMGSSADDLAKVIVLMMNRGSVGEQEIIPASLIEEMLTPEADPGTRYGPVRRKHMGLAWYLGEYRGETIVHHFGGYEGAQAHVSFMPAFNVGVAVTANSAEDATEMIHYMAADVYDTVMGKKLSKWPKKLAKASARAVKASMEEQDRAPDAIAWSQPADAYAGVYTSPKWGRLVVYTEGNTVTGHIGDYAFIFAETKDGIVAQSMLTSFNVTADQAGSDPVQRLVLATESGWTMEFDRSSK